MTHEIEYVKFEGEEESEIILTIKITRFKDSPNIKFEMLMKPIKESEMKGFKHFVEYQILKGNYETIYNYEDIKRKFK